MKEDQVVSVYTYIANRSALPFLLIPYSQKSGAFFAGSSNEMDLEGYRKWLRSKYHIKRQNFREPIFRRKERSLWLTDIIAAAVGEDLNPTSFHPVIEYSDWTPYALHLYERIDGSCSAEWKHGWLTASHGKLGNEFGAMDIDAILPKDGKPLHVFEGKHRNERTSEASLAVLRRILVPIAHAACGEYGFTLITHDPVRREYTRRLATGEMNTMSGAELITFIRLLYGTIPWNLVKENIWKGGVEPQVREDLWFSFSRDTRNGLARYFRTHPVIEMEF